MRARRPVTLYTVAGLPAAVERPEHGHASSDAVGFVVMRTLPFAPSVDLAAFPDGQAAAAELFARRARHPQGSGVVTIARVLTCGCRSSAADPHPDVLANSMPCESGDGYLDPAVDSEVVCQTDSGHYHDDCHAAVCRSRACHGFNFGDE